jgi:hypothetical protein
VTPAFDTLRTVAAALNTHPALLVQKDAWTWTSHEFTQWKLGMLWNERGKPLANVGIVEMVKVFLATRPEHAYARKKLCTYYGPRVIEFTLDAELWTKENAASMSGMLRHPKKARKQQAAVG